MGGSGKGVKKFFKNSEGGMKGVEKNVYACLLL